MSQLHKFKVDPIDGHPDAAQITIDDKPILCRGYELKHYSGSRAEVNIEIICVPKLEDNATVNVSNKEEIAALMEREEFEEFCEIWGKIHNG